MIFEQIVIVDKVTIDSQTLKTLNHYSKNPIICFQDDPKSDDETLKRISTADCVLLSWRTALNTKILSASKNLKFIGLCATNSNNIDVKYCQEHNIPISNVIDYGEIGVAEWVFLELLKLARGFGRYQWKGEPSELYGKTIGIIGFGTIGKLVASIALGFNMKVLYFSKTRKKDWEEKGAQYCEKQELLANSDIITLQTPKNLKVLSKQDFEMMNGKILVNNTLGEAFEREDFIEWIAKKNNFAIMDNVTDFGGDFQDYERVIFRDIVSGLTKECISRLGNKVVDNVEAFLAGKPINKIW